MARHFKPHGKAFIAALLVALVLLLDAMAACPSLHELIHQDANASDHHCVVTLFAHGQVDSATVEVAAAGPLVSIETTSQFEFSVFTPAIQNLPAGRGPPVSLLHS
ncbi:MAG TPA: hypothetical protein VG347_09600 [Verrucomicrobiae bacterium]|nr:hypothetical protein [Verrucomicrobiae bacterium]